MCREVFDLVLHMDQRALETKLAMQCAPLITGLKPSNLLTIPTGDYARLGRLLACSELSMEILAQWEGTMVLLLYQKERLESYLKNQRVRRFLAGRGYHGFQLQELLPLFCRRYQQYLEESRELAQAEFPHELGVLLGYPMEDIEGFIRHQGQQFLYSGYWKVYERPEEKKALFANYELAKEELIRQMFHGVSMRQLLEHYQERRAWKRSAGSRPLSAFAYS